MSCKTFIEDDAKMMSSSYATMLVNTSDIIMTFKTLGIYSYIGLLELDSHAVPLELSQVVQ